MEGRLQAFTEGSFPATVDAQVVGTTGSIHFSSLSPPALLSPSYSLASKNTSSNKRANIFLFYSLSISETKRLGRKMPHSREERRQLLSPPPQVSIIGQGEKRLGGTAGKKNKGIINPGSLKR